MDHTVVNEVPIIIIYTFLITFRQFASKQMARSAKKCEKDEKAEKLKLKKVYNYRL